MAGKKGKSGRKTRSLEMRYTELEGICVTKALEIMRGTDKKKQFALIKDVISKGMPQRIKHGMDADAKAGAMGLVFYFPQKDNGISNGEPKKLEAPSRAAGNILKE
jgi:hypothetical protein